MSASQLQLRPIEPDDHRLFQGWQNDPEIARWMDYPLLFSARDVDEDQERTRHEGHAFAIAVDGRTVGKCGLNQLRWRLRLGALYIYFGDSAARGRGLGRLAVARLLGLGFDQLNLERVEVTLLADNQRAQRLYASCGFELEGRLRGRAYRDGKFSDTLIMSVERAAFARVRAEVL